MSLFEPYLIITAFTLALLFPSMKHQLSVDDANSRETATKSKKLLLTTKRHFLKRLASILYGAGTIRNIQYDHLLRLILVLITVNLIYLVSNNIWISLIWVAHPINSQLTLWLNGRRYLISMILGLLAFKFTYTGIILFPIAVFFHPVSIVVFFASLIIKGKITLLWLLGTPFMYWRLEDWYRERFKIQPFEEYQVFRLGKISLAIRTLGEYFIRTIIPHSFTMYHPTIWGLSELMENKKGNYAFNASFFGYTAVIVSILTVGWLTSRSCLIGAFLAILAVFQWLNIWKSVTQLWAERYACYFSIFVLYFLMQIIDVWSPKDFTYLWKMSFLTWCVCITLKEMKTYRNFYTFFLNQVFNQPNNLNLCYTAVQASNDNIEAYMKENKMIDVAMNDALGMAYGFHWVIHHKQADMIHEFMNQKLGLSRPLKQKDN